MLLLQYFNELTIRPKNAKKLKGLILELAVRGKLTQQWRADNPDTASAQVLLNQIKAEKKRLIAAKEIKKEKPLPKIDAEEIPFDVPESWVWTRLGSSIKTILGGGTPSKRNPLYWDGNIPWASVKDLKNYKYLIKTVDNITEEGLTNSSSNLIPPKNIIVCTRMGLGKICINEIQVAINQDLKAIFLTEQVNTDFFYNTYRTLKIEGTGVTVSGIRQDELLKLLIPLPPLEEQKAIVTIVEQLFQEVENLEALTQKRLTIKQAYVQSILQELETGNTHQVWQQLQPNFGTFFDTTESVKALRQTILQLAVQGKLTTDWRSQNPTVTPASELLKQIQAEKAALVKAKKIRKEKALPKIKAEEIPFELPVGWVWSRLREVTHSLGQKKPNTDFQYIDVSAIDNQKGKIKDDIKIVPFTNAPSRARKIVKKGTVIYSTVRPYLKNIAIIENDFSPEAIASTAFAILYPTANYSSKYLFYYLRSTTFTEYVESKMKGVSYPAINDKNFFNGLICLPSLPEQKAIVQKIEQLMGFCDALEANVENKSNRLELLINSALNEVLGVTSFVAKQSNKAEKQEKPSRLIKFDSKTIFMDLVELLKEHGKLHAEDLWKMSKFPNDIDAFYAALKSEVEVNETIKESDKKGYLELI